MNSFYILVMDKNNTAGEDTWYITRQAVSCEEIKTVTSHDDTIVRQLPKESYPGVECCPENSPKELLNTHSGSMEPGKIYEIHKI